jgi:hypothetical protein
MGPSGNPMLIVVPVRGTLAQVGRQWGAVNNLRNDLEQVFGQSVFIVWDDG